MSGTRSRGQEAAAISLRWLSGTGRSKRLANRCRAAEYGPVTGGSNDVGHLRQLAEAGSHYTSVDSVMRMS
jgi:hypothetical protein